jgi:hypothetical protein
MSVVMIQQLLSFSVQFASRGGLHEPRGASIVLLHVTGLLSCPLFCPDGRAASSETVRQAICHA